MLANALTHRTLIGLMVAVMGLSIGGCFDNNPFPNEDISTKTFFYSYPSQNKYLDPIKSYNSGEYRFLTTIYEPPYQFHYLKRPSVVIPRSTAALPTIERFDGKGKLLPAEAPPGLAKKVVYTIRLQDNMLFQNHPCFERTEDGKYRWHLGEDGAFPDVDHPHQLMDGTESKTTTRQLRAEDYVYQIKRFAHPLLACPVLNVFEKRIVGMLKYKTTLADEVKRIRNERKAAAGVDYNREKDEQNKPIYIDLRNFDLEGVKIIDDLTYTITLAGDFPQLTYWMTLPFFSPMAWEATRFYSQPAAAARNFTLQRHPVGSGPYIMTENQPNYRIILERNPNFRTEHYPTEGAEGDEEAGLLEAAGKQLPFIDRAVFMLDQEAPPRWSKFLQGYCDLLEIETRTDDNLSSQVVNVSQLGVSDISPDLKSKGIQLHVGQRPFVRYFAFNMKDPVYGKNGESSRKLRQAISIAVDMNQYIEIFWQGRGRIAHSPLPIGLPGHREGKDGINPVVYDWEAKAGVAVPRSIEVAKKLMAEAGYPNGRGPDGKQLELRYDGVAGRNGKDSVDWLNRQLKPLGIKANLLTTDSNQWVKKLAEGNFQFMDYGWYADYPDAENFLFLLYGPNGKADHHGENYANYRNPEYDKLFQQMVTMPDSPERREIIDKMVKILRHDAPWLFGWQPDSYAMNQPWLKNYKSRFIGSDALKYFDIDTTMRAQQLPEWNQPVIWPLLLLVLVVAMAAVPATRAVLQRRRGETNA